MKAHSESVNDQPKIFLPFVEPSFQRTGHTWKWQVILTFCFVNLVFGKERISFRF